MFEPLPKMNRKYVFIQYDVDADIKAALRASCIE